MIGGLNRRDFLAGLSCAAGGAVCGCASRVAHAKGARQAPPRFMWAYLAHFGMKLWESRLHYADLKVDDSMWKSMTEKAAEIGVNTLVIDLGEGMVFESHPELSVRGSWSPDRMRAEIARLKSMGVMAIPKLNFSSSHDQWLGKWRPYLSTPEYFRVCSEIIADVADVFDETPFFHIGYDEESHFIQDYNKFEYIRLRTGNLWWHDFLWFVAEVERHGMRPWIWSDYCWFHRESFLARMPRSVLQSNWYYGGGFDAAKLSDQRRPELVTYQTLEEGRYDQVPCGSTYEDAANFGRTVEYCRREISSGRLKGFLMAPWYYRTMEDKRGKIMASLKVMGDEIRKWNASDVQGAEEVL